jgi:hypothetical protein
MIKSSIKFRYRPAWKARKYASGNEMRKASTVRGRRVAQRPEELLVVGDSASVYEEKFQANV